MDIAAPRGSGGGGDWSTVGPSPGPAHGSSAPQGRPLRTSAWCCSAAAAAVAAAAAAAARLCCRRARPGTTPLHVPGRVALRRKTFDHFQRCAGCCCRCIVCWCGVGDGADARMEAAIEGAAAAEPAAPAVALRCRTAGPGSEAPRRGCETAVRHPCAYDCTRRKGTVHRLGSPCGKAKQPHLSRWLVSR